MVGGVQALALRAEIGPEKRMNSAEQLSGRDASRWHSPPSFSPPVAPTALSILQPFAVLRSGLNCDYSQNPEEPGDIRK